MVCPSRWGRRRQSTGGPSSVVGDIVARDGTWSQRGKAQPLIRVGVARGWEKRMQHSYPSKPSHEISKKCVYMTRDSHVRRSDTTPRFCPENLGWASTDILDRLSHQTGPGRPEEAWPTMSKHASPAMSGSILVLLPARAAPFPPPRGNLSQSTGS